MYGSYKFSCKMVTLGRTVLPARVKIWICIHTTKLHRNDKNRNAGECHHGILSIILYLRLTSHI